MPNNLTKPNDDDQVQGKKPNFKGNRNKDRKGKNYKKPTPIEQKKGNHASWWKNYPSLMAVAAKYPWMFIKGTKYADDNPVIGFTNVCRVNYSPTLGVSTESTSPLNLAFRRLWIDMNKQFRGIGSYESSDLGIVVICLVSLFARIAEAQRLYGIANTWIDTDRTYATGLLSAAGLSTDGIDWLYANMADYRYRLNLLIAKAQSLILPKGFSLLKSWISLNGFVYRDAEENPDRSGTIIFVPDYYYLYEEEMESVPTSALVMREDARASSSLDTYLDSISAQLERLLVSEDVNKMCADMLAFFQARGSGEAEILLELPENFKVPTEYSEEILLKLHNATCLGSDVGSGMHLFFRTPSEYWSAYATRYGNTEAVYGMVTQLNNRLLAAPQIYEDEYIPTTDYQVINRTISEINFSTLSVEVATTATFNESNPDSFTALQTVVMREYPQISDTWHKDAQEDDYILASLWKVHARTETQLVSTKNYMFTEIVNICTEVIRNVQFMKVYDGSVHYTTVLYGYHYAIPEARANMDIQYTSASKIDWHPLEYSIGIDNGVVLTKYLKAGIAGEPFGDLDNFCIHKPGVYDEVKNVALLSAYYLPYSMLDSEK